MEKDYCNRFFLQKKGYHTKYCDLPNPENPRYTCAQLGYHYKGIKEAIADNPKAQSLRRCKLRIDKDYNRANISEEEQKLLIRTAKDLYYEARTTPGISDEEFEISLQSENLYPLCGVERYSHKRGRPKKAEK